MSKADDLYDDGSAGRQHKALCELRDYAKELETDLAAAQKKAENAQRLESQIAAAKKYATRILLYMAKKFPDLSPKFAALDTLSGILSQIDNSACGLEHKSVSAAALAGKKLAEQDAEDLRMGEAVQKFAVGCMVENIEKVKALPQQYLKHDEAESLNDFSGYWKASEVLKILESRADTGKGEA